MLDVEANLASLVEAVQDLVDSLRDVVQDQTVTAALTRLGDSVVRPLGDAIASAPAPTRTFGAEHTSRDATGDSSTWTDRVWKLAQEATELRCRIENKPALQEAVAALQGLALGLADDERRASRLAELEELYAGLGAQIQVAGNGPYLVTNAKRLSNWLGERLPVQPQMALCRCGESNLKPHCDGSHARIGFNDAKDPHRIPDRVDAFVGEQVTILDNRGTCQHSGYCTDRLASVFRTDTDPFVAPSGGRMDEIIRAVRDCPSGALSYSFDGHEARAQVDHNNTREPAIEVSKDGPYRITGAIPLRDADGRIQAQNHGASREHFALCRCGHSQNKPYCSGMHWYVEFKSPVAEPDDEPTLFEWCGGLPALVRMTRLFYEKYVPDDPLLAPLFANMSADHPERVAKWLAEVFCGPKHYSEEYGGYTRMISQHLGKGISEEQRGRWVALIQRSAQESGLPNDPEFRSVFGSYIEWGTRLAVENSQPGAHPPPQMPMPRWDWNTAAGPPGSRVSALSLPDEGPEQPAVLPGPVETVRFGAHIKTLFRTRDRQSMRFAFDLWSYDDVCQHADSIMSRLAAGTMPCDGRGHLKKSRSSNDGSRAVRRRESQADLRGDR